MISDNKKPKLDLTSLAVFLPSVIALAIIPTLMRATIITTDSIKTQMLFHGFETATEGEYGLIDVYSQVKAFAVVLFAIVMLIMAVICCIYLFRRTEMRRLVYVGASAVFVAMTLISAIGSEVSEVAFYGTHDHAEGFFTIACYFVMFLYTMYAFKSTKNFRYVIIALMVCTGINLIIGLFQYFGNNLFNYEWFRNIAVSPECQDILAVNEAVATEKARMFGALYHYNYMGSFTGMIIPLFTTLAVTGEKVWHKIICGAFALIGIVMLITSEARSGFVAVAAAGVIGLIVFARVLIRRWKITVSVIAVAVVGVIGLNIVSDNALFARIPSLVEDVVSFVTPSEETDLFDTLPVREINHNQDGSVSFTTQTDVLTLKFNPETLSYDFTDSSGAILETGSGPYGSVTITDEDFKDIYFEFASSSSDITYYDGVFMWLEDNDDSALLFYLFNNKQLHLVDFNTGIRVVPENAEAIGFKGKEKLGSSRGYIWSRTIPLLENCLVTGYGPDTFAYVFPQTDYLAKYYAYEEGFYMMIDKPHNLYLQIFYGSGLVALVAFLVICAFYLIDSLRLYALRKTYRIEQIYGISVMLGIVGYLAAGLFNDSVVSVAPVFWILLGVGAALNTINRRMDRGEDPDTDIVSIRRKSKKELQHEAAVEQQANDLAASIRGEHAEQREADRRKLEEVMKKYKAAAEAEEAARKHREERRKQRELEAENAPPKPKKETISKQEADDMLARVRALKEKTEAEKAPRSSVSEENTEDDNT